MGDLISEEGQLLRGLGVTGQLGERDSQVWWPSTRESTNIVWEENSCGVQSCGMIANLLTAEDAAGWAVENAGASSR